MLQLNLHQKLRNHFLKLSTEQYLRSYEILELQGQFSLKKLSFFQKEEPNC